MRPPVVPVEILSNCFETASMSMTAILFSKLCTHSILSRLGSAGSAAAMVTCDIRIHDAMITTLGDRAEDTFLVTDAQDCPLDEIMRGQLVKAINQRLEDS